MSTTDEDIGNAPPKMEANEVAYFTTNYYPRDYPFKVQRVTNGWLLTIPNLVKQFLDVDERIISYSSDCFVHERFVSDWETLIGTVEYYITQYGYEDAPGYPIANDNIYYRIDEELLSDDNVDDDVDDDVDDAPARAPDDHYCELCCNGFGDWSSGYFALQGSYRAYRESGMYPVWKGALKYWLDVYENLVQQGFALEAWCNWQDHKETALYRQTQAYKDSLVSNVSEECPFE